MNKKAKINFVVSGILLVAFVIFTIMVAKVDVANIGPENSSVGFSSFNGKIRDAIGLNKSFYNITEYLGLIAVATVPIFGLIGFVQLLKGKKLSAVDKDIMVLGMFYVIVAATYALFEVVIINYRPVILEEGLEASYPSSHSMIALCFFGFAMVQAGKRIKKSSAKNIVLIILGILLVATVVGRLLSGVHWATDIFAGTILGLGYVLMYNAIVELID